MTAVYIINRTSSSTSDGKTPEEVWYRKISDYAHLRTFSYAAFSHQSVGKLEPRYIKCVFMGYPEGVKGYRLWDRSVKGFRMITSRNVTFNECDMPCMTEKPQEIEPVKDKDEEIRLQVEFRTPAEHTDEIQINNEAVPEVEIKEIRLFKK